MDTSVECSTSNGRKRETGDVSLMPEKKKARKEQDVEQCPPGKTPCK
ncbi:unnamed protein product [Angiostrongylus costaricensis]|uniref:TCP11 n=1 Tax=Angiostrongylus costaricensis TaxID=334426 RepID=A0A0R3PZD4_ANGCS|nr:unnamed protein product [Angiostrongylus costaricensis]